jgi:PhzF family phenazine biosynthesis protein
MTYSLYQVDAFSGEPFKGNPAAVCLLEASREEGWMQALAAEMNLSETAFLSPHPQGKGWNLRWFTPATEVDLCGHATLASARVLFELHPELRNQTLSFHTRSGELRASWMDGKVGLDFPVKPPEPIDFEADLSDVLGFQPVEAPPSRILSPWLKARHRRLSSRPAAISPNLISSPDFSLLNWALMRTP